MVRRILLVCGILAALLYVGSDIYAAWSWEGYSYTARSVSELRAIGAPTRAFLVPTLFVYSLLELVFGVGVWRSAGDRRSVRIAGALLVALALVDLSAYFFPMRLGGTMRGDAMHLVLTALTVLMILLVIGFGANANGRWFRIYSYISIAVILIAGAWAGMDAPRIEAGLPTPWMGARERLNIYGYMLWMLMLALVLWRSPAPAKTHKPPVGIGPAQLTPR